MRKALLAFLLFLPMATVGTQVHEAGHYAMCVARGGHAVLHYGSADCDGDEGLAVIAGGPLLNMAIGTAGLLLLRRRRTMPAAVPALFWSRQPFDLAGMVAIRLVTGETPVTSDEARIGLALGLGAWPVAVATGLLGAAACLAVVAWVPRGWRGALVVGGVPGCLVGFAAWYGLFGPMFLP